MKARFGALSPDADVARRRPRANARRRTGAQKMAVLLALAASAACGGAQKPQPSPPERAGLASVPVVPELSALEAAQKALASSNYPQALRHFERASRESDTRTAALLGLAKVSLLSGDYDAASAARPELDGSKEAAELLLVRAQALRAQGRLSEAQTLLQQKTSPASPGGAPVAQRLLLGELLLEQGKLDEGNAVLMTIIEDYNEDRVTDSDAKALAIVGRAAHFLRSPEDANDAFNQAEVAGADDVETLLWRAELFLEKYDPGHAEEVTLEVLSKAPHHPDALVIMAQVQLDQALDFDRARGFVEDALAVNPKHTGAHALLAGLSLRDMKLEEAKAHIDAGLAINSRDLHLLSVLGVIHFLGDDMTAFADVRDQVFSLNPHYSRFFQVVGRYADWEHRYAEIVDMMREAIAIDDDDANAHAELGFNLIRNGDDQAGVSALRRAFAKDPYNVRVFNTLNLYEKVIPESYVDVTSGSFQVRYPKAERAVLERYVPDLLGAAWNKMRGYYEFTPSEPVGIELYSERSNFAIRTSGLPRTAIQGVCFGKTLASMSPRHEQFNIGMTLWHELAHVFHIQLSKSHVPRWFTEGLAEYETLVERPEWARERDQELYLALRAKRLPKLDAMNEAFTHAEDIGDVAVAYYASSRIVEMMASQYGRPKLREMLVSWGEGKRTPEVLQTALGKSTQELDVEFRHFLEQRLSRYDDQFVPDQRIGDPRKVQEAVKRSPKDPDAQARFALLAMTHGELAAALRSIGRALAVDPKHPDALWLQGKIALEREDFDLATEMGEKLERFGHDGYETQILLGRAALGRKDDAAMERALKNAHAFDPTKAEPLYGLLQRSAGDPTARQSWLAKLVRLDEHNGDIYRELSERLSRAGEHGPALEAGLSGVYAAMEDPTVHVAYAEALEKAGRFQEARFEFESALDCPAAPRALAVAHLSFASFLERQGDTQGAKQQRARALEVDAVGAGQRLP